MGRLRRDAIGRVGGTPDRTRTPQMPSFWVRIAAAVVGGELTRVFHRRRKRRKFRSRCLNPNQRTKSASPGRSRTTFELGVEHAKPPGPLGATHMHQTKRLEPFQSLSLDGT